MALGTNSTRSGHGCPAQHHRTVARARPRASAECGPRLTRSPTPKRRSHASSKPSTASAQSRVRKQPWTSPTTKSRPRRLTHHRDSRRKRSRAPPAERPGGRRSRRAEPRDPSAAAAASKHTSQPDGRHAPVDRESAAPARKNGHRIQTNRATTPRALRDQNIAAIGECPERDGRTERDLQRRNAKTDMTKTLNELNSSRRTAPGR